MSDMSQLFFNEEHIRDAHIQTAPAGFRYGFVADVLDEPMYVRLMREFPDVTKFTQVDKMSGGGHKKFYVGPGYVAGRNWGCTCHMRSLSPIWRDFLAVCASPAVTRMFSERIGVPLNSLCNFGPTYGNEGCVQEAHVDGAVREYDDGPVKAVWTAILYFNEQPAGPGGTCVYDTDRTTILLQAPSMRNGLFFFEQHPQAWHGFPVMPEGTERRVLGLAYSREKEPIELKENVMHRLGCKNFWKSVIRGV